MLYKHIYSTIVLLAIVLLSLVSFCFTDDSVLIPAIVSCLILLYFCQTIQSTLSSSAYCEIGFVYLLFLVAYTAVPGFYFCAIDFDFTNRVDSLGFAVSNPSVSEISLQMWRQTAYIFVFNFAYLLSRGKSKIPSVRVNFELKSSVYLILISLLVLVVYAAASYSAPVIEYIDNYTRYDHLGFLDKKILQALLLIKDGIIYLLFTLVLLRRPYNIQMALSLLISVCVFQIFITNGSRIESLYYTLYFSIVYSLCVKQISAKRILLLIILLALFFSAFEFYRTAGFSIDNLSLNITNDDFIIPQEFNAVFYTAFHLYHIRNLGVMPHISTLYYFGDMLTLVPFFDHYQYNIQHWYATIFFPDSIVPPQTMGPIVESAIWFGYGSIICNSFVTGLFYSIISRCTKYFINNVFGLLTYGMFWCTTMIAIKYSVFIQIGIVFKVVVFAVLAYLIVKILKKRIVRL